MAIIPDRPPQRPQQSQPSELRQRARAGNILGVTPVQAQGIANATGAPDVFLALNQAEMEGFFGFEPGRLSEGHKLTPDYLLERAEDRAGSLDVASKSKIAGESAGQIAKSIGTEAPVDIETDDPLPAEDPAYGKITGAFY